MSQCDDCLCQGLGPQASRVLREALPKGPAGDHFRNARVEFLKGLRSLLDARIDELSRPTSPTQGTRLTVDE